MYPQMLAYKAAGGLDNIKDMSDAQQITLDQLQAWNDIDEGIKNSDSGKIWDGNTLLAQVEQLETIQKVFDQEAKTNFWNSVTSFALNPWAIESPMPGDNSTFQQINPGVSFSDGQARFHWFKATMVNAWKGWRMTNNYIDLKTLLNGGYK